MERAGIAILVVIALAGGVASWTAPGLQRIERIALALLHVVAACVAVATAVSLGLQTGDGRALALCALGPLFVVVVRHDDAHGHAGLLSGALVGLGLAVQGLAMAGQAATWAGGACGAVGAAASGIALARLLRRRRAARSMLGRARVDGDLVAGLWCAATGIAMLMPDLPSLAQHAGHALGGAGPSAWSIPFDVATTWRTAWSGVWGAALAAAIAWTTAVRVGAMVSPRDGLSFVVAGALVATATGAVSARVDLALAFGAWATAIAASALALARATLREPTPRRSTSTAAAVIDDVELHAGALGAMAPILDDALLRRPGRPRMLVRTPVKRLVDAAIDRARAAQPRKSARDDVRVELNTPEGEGDVDGDPGELAEALCAVVDNALRQRARIAETRVHVQVRSSPHSVTFEVANHLRLDTSSSDGASATTAAAPGATTTPPALPAPGSVPDADAPFLSARIDDEDRPGLGVGLARARLLVERNGGKLVTRGGTDGSFVQLTLPRRLQRGPVGIA